MVLGWGWETQGDIPVPGVRMLWSSVGGHPGTYSGDALAPVWGCSDCWCRDAPVPGVGTCQSLVSGHVRLWCGDMSDSGVGTPSLQWGDTRVASAEITQSLMQGCPGPQGGVPRPQYGGALDPSVTNSEVGMLSSLAQGSQGLFAPPVWVHIHVASLHPPSLPP